MYSEFFTKSDNVISHIQSLAEELDAQFQPDYAGFVCVIAVATYEMAIRELLYDFCSRTHRVFGDFFQSRFPRINGNISVDDIKKNFLRHFGERFRDDFNDMINYEEQLMMKRDGVSMLTSYDNIIVWRNCFAHTASFTANATLKEVCSSYYIGKNIVLCLDIALSS